jgi:mycofactocin glycosyltransferase
VCRASALRAVGGFDESLRYGEDVDLVWRLTDAGWRCRYEPSTVVLHPTRPSLRAWCAQRFRYGTAAAALDRRHPGSVPATAMSPWSVAVWVLVAARRPWWALALAATTTALYPRKLQPTSLALRLASRGHLDAGLHLAAAVRGPWIVPALAASIVSGHARSVLAVSMLAVRPLRVLDTASYGFGVAAGCLRERTLGPLRAKLSG